MPRQTNTARFVLKAGEHTVTRDQILRAIEEADRKKGLPKSRKGWSVEENGNRYDPKWILKLATGDYIRKFTHEQARETLSALGFKLGFDPNWKSNPQPPNGDDAPDEEEEAEEPKELTFDIERNLQSALRANIEQLEAGLRITDGGKEKKQIDITAEDRSGTAVVIELKVGEAGRRAIGQISGYMGELAGEKKPVRGILVANDFSPRAIAATRVIPSLQLRKYSFKFTFEIVRAG